MTLMFTHKATGAWDALAKGLMEAGFVITASWPINTEAGGSLHIRDKAAANSTVFLACRPRPAERAAEARDAVTYWEDVEPRVANAVRTRVAEFQQAGIAGVDLYLACFGPALEEFSRNWPLTRGTPRERPTAARRGQQDVLEDDWDPYAATPEDALDAARREVKRWRLEQLTRKQASEDLDAPTAFFVLAWDAFKAPVFAYDEALRLARAVGVDMDAQWRSASARSATATSACGTAPPAQRKAPSARWTAAAASSTPCTTPPASAAAARWQRRGTCSPKRAWIGICACSRRSRQCWKCCRCRTASRRWRCRARPPRPATTSRRSTTLPGWRMRRRWIGRGSWSCGWGKGKPAILLDRRIGHTLASPSWQACPLGGSTEGRVTRKTPGRRPPRGEALALGSRRTRRRAKTWTRPTAFFVLAWDGCATFGGAGMGNLAQGFQPLSVSHQPGAGAQCRPWQDKHCKATRRASGCSRTHAWPRTSSACSATRG